jgi:malate dehydrogenase (oxaloacetate-decarboxylating)(NADP+)
MSTNNQHENFNFDTEVNIDALKYHQYPRPGKIQIINSKPVSGQKDLSLAYSPGVAAPCMKIAQDPFKIYDYTNKPNLVAVISNGTAVLGLGNIGAAASKPVMEGKALLFKKFAGIDVFDIEINETDIDKFVDIVASLEATFGGVNLEDIKAPECFEIERKLKERMAIPVMHDDQHGTAIVVAAGIINGVKIANKNLNNVKIVVSGAGAAAIACLDLLVSLGANKSNIFVADSTGIINHKRTNLTETKVRYQQNTNYDKLEDAMHGADILIGLSGPGTVSQAMIKSMNKDPIVFALANPTPEIMPDLIKEVRQDAIIATGRSDFPNQVNNSLVFPYLFRGALDVRATVINEDMKKAAVYALSELALVPSNINLEEDIVFGRNYFIPNSLDPRLITAIAPKVARAAIDTKVSRVLEFNEDEYRESLLQYINVSHMFMRPVVNAAQKKQKHILLCDGEDERVLGAIAEIRQSKIAKITVIGRPYVIEQRIAKLAIPLVIGQDFDVINIEDDKRYKNTWQEYLSIMIRKGVNKDMAKQIMRTDTTAIAAILVKQGLFDGMVCGLANNYHHHLRIIKNILPYNNSEHVIGALNALILPTGNLFIADTHINYYPTAEDLTQITIMAAKFIRRLQIEPKVALISHSSFGSDHVSESAQKMRNVLQQVKKIDTKLMIDGEMRGDAALIPEVLQEIMPNSTLKAPANLLIMPNLESANIAYNLMRVSSHTGVAVGPILLGMDKVNILQMNSSIRRIVNIVAMTAVGV